MSDAAMATLAITIEDLKELGILEQRRQEEEERTNNTNANDDTITSDDREKHARALRKNGLAVNAPRPDDENDHRSFSTEKERKTKVVLGPAAQRRQNDADERDDENDGVRVLDVMTNHLEGNHDTNTINHNKAYSQAKSGLLDFIAFIIKLKTQGDKHSTSRNNDDNNKFWTTASPLLAAVEYGDGSVVELLLEHGADPNDAVDGGDNSHGGCSPLQAAIRSGNHPMVNLLLRHGANPSLRNHVNGQTPLHEACAYGHLAIVSELLTLTNAANEINAKDDSGRTPLDIAKDCGHADVVDKIEDSTSKRRAKRAMMLRLLSPPWLPLHEACRSSGDASTVNDLLQCGADPDPRFLFGLTPLHLASHHGHVQVVELLLQRGADPNHRDHDGFGALHAACRNGHYDVAKLLLQFHADPNAANVVGWTPLHEACQCRTSSSSHSLLLSWLIGHGANPNAGNKNGWTPLHVACQNGKDTVVRFLLSHGADPNATSRDRGWTPLHVACQYGHHDTVLVLLKHVTTNPNLRDTLGGTPLHLASGEAGQDIIVQSLLDWGGNPNTRNNLGRTPLHEASLNGHVVAVSCMMKKKANAHIQDNTGSTPLDIAQDLGKNDIIIMLGGCPRERFCTALKCGTC